MPHFSNMKRLPRDTRIKLPERALLNEFINQISPNIRSTFMQEPHIARFGRRLT
jgi:hypothetical protein